MWQEVEGHDEVARGFRSSARCGRLASTYLFVGPEGVGKRTFALKLAGALLCTASDPAELTPCGKCDSCRLMAAGNHPDLDYVARPPGKRSLPIDLFLGDRDHRNKEGLCHNIALRPMLGQRRIAIIDDADWLTTESANCLLKTLEEPPQGAVIILIGTSRSRQLPTILSRSQIVRFHPLPAETVASLLLTLEIVDDPATAARLAEACEGSLSKAEELADGSAWQLRERLQKQLAAPRLDVARLGKDLNDSITDAGKDAESRRQRFRQCLNVAEEVYLADLHSACQGNERPAARRALAALDRCLEAEEQLARNANQATLLECWLDDLAELQKVS